MPCYGYGVYTPTDLVLTEPGPGRGCYVWGTYDYLQYYVPGPSTGLSCADARSDYDAQIYDFTYPSDQFVEVGSSFDKPAADLVNFHNVSDQWDNQQYGVSITCTVLVDDGAGGTTNESRGAYHICSSIDTAPTCQPFGDGFNAPSFTHTLHETDSLTGSFPIVLEEAGTAGNVVGVSWNMQTYSGPAFGVTGSLSCPPGPHGASYDASTFIVPDGLAWNLTFNFLTDYTDLDAQFCCLAEGQGCAGCGGPAPITGTGFLIPNPNVSGSPTDTQARASTPVLRTPLRVSNHTFQFRNSF